MFKKTRKASEISNISNYKSCLDFELESFYANLRKNPKKDETKKNTTDFSSERMKTTEFRGLLVELFENLSSPLTIVPNRRL